MDGVIGWLSGLPLAVLYPLMAVVAAVENVFPPIPADMVVAFGSWLAAKGEGSALGAFAAVWLGNVAGAGGMYAVGRSHGAEWLRKKFPRLADERGLAKLEKFYGKYGLIALFVSRFIPGVRAVVPPFAGALKISPVGSMTAIAAASGIWYGFISYLAFTAGSDWDALMDRIRHSGTVVAIAATVILVAAAAVWFLRHRGQRST